MTNSSLQIRFWGVRGSVPTPSQENLGYGGNTTCLEVRTRRGLFVIDGGTGARSLGLHLEQEFQGAPLNLHFLLTHLHWDHIQGLPHFRPLFSPDHKITFYSHWSPEQLKHCLEGQMSAPYFPVSFELLAARREFVDCTSALASELDISIRPFPLYHPQGATGFRIEADGAVIIHASDVEHGNAEFDMILRQHAQNADILIYDAQYTPEEYTSKKGWGHSTWLEATRIAEACSVKRLVLFHHDPNHNDETIDRIVQEARRCFPNTEAAREGGMVCA